MKIVQKLERCTWGVLTPLVVLGWKAHTYQSDGISARPLFVLGGRLRPLVDGGDVCGYFR